MKNPAARLNKSVYLQISELGSKFNLSFSDHWVFNNKIIALDAVKKQLLVFETNKTSNQSYVIELNKVAAVTVKKAYSSIRAGELKNKRIEAFLQRIDVQFEYSNKTKIVIPFYDAETDDRGERVWLERGAAEFQMQISMMAGSQTNKVMTDSLSLS